LSKIISVDETHWFQYDSQKQPTKFAMEAADIPMIQEISRVKITKTMLITFFDIKAVVHFKFIPQGQSTKFITWKY
jgi:hypothetical protein